MALSPALLKIIYQKVQSSVFNTCKNKLSVTSRGQCESIFHLFSLVRIVGLVHTPKTFSSFQGLLPGCAAHGICAVKFTSKCQTSIEPQSITIDLVCSSSRHVNSFAHVSFIMVLYGECLAAIP